jgi:hypothetical protein
MINPPCLATGGDYTGECPYGRERAADALLTTAEVAERLRVSTSFLAKARVTGLGPRFIKIGRACRYRLSDLESYERSRARTSTSEH